MCWPPPTNRKLLDNEEGKNAYLTKMLPRPERGREKMGAEKLRERMDEKSGAAQSQRLTFALVRTVCS